MSRDNTEKKKLSREERKKWVVRIVAMIMAILMILGLGVTAISIILGSRARAAEPVSVIDTSSLKQSGDVLISVGISWGSSVAVSFPCTSEEGFIVGSQETEGDRSFRELWTLDNPSVICASDTNLSFLRGACSIAGSERSTDIGGYHLEINCADCDREDLERLIEETRWDAARWGLNLIPAYIHGYYVIRAGSFSSWTDADDALRDAEELFPDRRVSVVSPTATGVQVIDPDSETTILNSTATAPSSWA